jgi:peptide/nickel transport system permease protein
MSSYMLRRTEQLLLVLLGVSVVVFLLARISGDPATVLIPLDAPPEARERYRRQLGLDDPLAIQYGRFLVRAVQGDFGVSLVYNSSVASLIAERLGATAELALVALSVALLLAVPIGVLSAVKRNSVVDRLSMVVMMVGQAMPLYWLGLMLILVFGVQLGFLPVSGRRSHSSIILPGITLASLFMARFARVTRSAMLEVLNQPYIAVARSKGLSERVVVWKHALKNAAIPVVTLLGLELGTLMSGAVVTETVFAWPGIGRLAYLAVVSRDYPLLQGIVLFTAGVFAAINLLVDFIYVYLDPRIRLGRSAGR